MATERIEVVVLFSALGGMFFFILAVVIVVLKAKNYFDEKFTDLKKLMFENFRLRDLAIRRIEFWAVRKDAEFQPGVEPLEFGDLPKDGSQGH